MKCISDGNGVHVDHLYSEPAPVNNHALKGKREFSKVKGVKVEGVKKLRNKESHKLQERKRRDIKRDYFSDLADELGLSQDGKIPSKHTILNQCIEYLISNKLGKVIKLPEPVSAEEFSSSPLDDKRTQHNAAERKRRHKLSQAYANLKDVLHLSNGSKVSNEKALIACLTKIRLHKDPLAMQKQLHGNDLVGVHHINKARIADHGLGSCSTIVYQDMGQGSDVDFEASGAVAKNANLDHNLGRTSPETDEYVDVESYSSDSCSSATDVSGIRVNSIYLGSGAPNDYLCTETVNVEEFLQDSGSELIHCEHQDTLEDPFKLPPLLLQQDTLDWPLDDAMYDVLPSPNGGICGGLSEFGVAEPGLLAKLSDLWSQDDGFGSFISPFCDSIPDIKL